MRRLLLPMYAALLLGIPLAAQSQVPSTGSGQGFPSKSIRIIAPFPPGAGTDTLARMLAGPLSKTLGQNIVVENRPGAGTVVGTEVAARSPADGHTVLIINVTESGPHIQAGKLRALAVTSLERSVDFKEVPTVAESGFPGFEAITWFGAVAPAATPKDSINRLNTEFVRALLLPDVRNGLSKLGLSGAGTSAEEFDAFIRSELRRNEKIARESNLRID